MAGKQKPKNEEKPRKRRSVSNDADWGSQDGDLLRELIEAVTKGDGAIRFGYTSDGGAYSVGIYGDGKPFTEFLPGSADCEEWLRGFIEDYG